jgi:hypothetical protein
MLMYVVHLVLKVPRENRVQREALEKEVRKGTEVILETLGPLG